MIVHQIPVLNDNYIYVFHGKDSNEAFVVDPALADPVIKFCQKHQLNVKAILNTHHHGDHVGGNLQIQSEYHCEIFGYGPDQSRIPGLTHTVEDNENVNVGPWSGKVLFVPGHTLGHIAYWFESEEKLFIGDTLFSLGCGRLFEGTAKQMWASLSRIKSLPSQTQVYCAHEYTEDNLKFTESLGESFPKLDEFASRIRQLRGENKPTVPMKLEDELNCNPFLRADKISLQNAVGLSGSSAEETFAHIRKLKDQF